jgi:hypothetical protein
VLLVTLSANLQNYRALRIARHKKSHYQIIGSGSYVSLLTIKMVNEDEYYKLSANQPNE